MEIRRGQISVDSAMDSDGMRDYIQNFSLDKCKLGNQGYNRVLLQLFGFMGHGKSCFINSCKYVIDNGPYKVYAEPAKPIGIKGGAMTVKRNSYKLTTTITLVDNRGCGKMNKDETGEIYAQLGNFLPLDVEVTWQVDGFNNTLKKLLKAEREDRSTDFIVPLFVYSAKTAIPDSDIQELKEVLNTAKLITGLVPAVVITHELSSNLPTVREKFRQMGVKSLFSLENYTEEDHLKTRGKHEAILKCLYDVIRDVEFRMGNKRDPVGEKIERKEMVFNFIHEREKEKAVLAAEYKAQEKADQEIKKAQEAQRKEKENADQEIRKAQEAQRKAKEDADQEIRKAQEAQRKAKEDADQEIRKAQEAQRKAKEDADQQIRKAQETQRKAKEDADQEIRKAQETQRKAKEDADQEIRKAQEAQRKAQERANTLESSKSFCTVQ